MSSTEQVMILGISALVLGFLAGWVARRIYDRDILEVSDRNVKHWRDLVTQRACQRMERP